MPESIGQRELRNDSGAVMRRVEAGESFVVTRNGRPVADLVPHARPEQTPEHTLSELHATFRAMPRMDLDRWRAERAAADELLGDDGIDS